MASPVREVVHGRHLRHAAINDIFRRALTSAGIRACLELTNLSRSDGKRPDGPILIPWSKGKPLVWDVTVLPREQAWLLPEQRQ